MLVGGKPEVGEDPLACAVREAAEEVGVRLSPTALEPLGTRWAPAANEPGHLVVGDCFVTPDWAGSPSAHAEIEELRWLPLTARPADDLAPLLTHRVLPLLRRRLGPAVDGANRILVRRAREADVPHLPAIEAAGDALFDEIGLDHVADCPVAAPADYAACLAAGRLHVAEADGRVVGFARVELVDDRPHLEQLSVHPAWSGAGIGRLLVEEATKKVAAQGHSAMTLRTFRDVPWNAPFYARLGWRPLGEDCEGPGLRALAETEHRLGLDANPRLLMIRDL